MPNQTPITTTNYSQYISNSQSAQASNPTESVPYMTYLDPQNASNQGFNPSNPKFTSFTTNQGLRQSIQNPQFATNIGSNQSNCNHNIRTGVPQKMKPKDFGGELPAANAWLQHFRLVSTNNGWDDSQKMTNAMLHLTGPAKDWFELRFIPPTDYELAPYSELILPTWQEFQEAFYQEYRFKDVELLLEKHLQDIVRQKMESYVDYGRRVLNIIRNIDPNMTEGRKLRFIRQGLGRDFNRTAFVNTESIEKLMKVFRRFDKDSTFPTEEMKTKSSETVTFQKTIPESTLGKPFFDRKQYTTPSSTSSQNAKEMKTQTTRTDVVCLNCNKQGHTYKMCSKKLDNAAIRDRFREIKAQRDGTYFDKKSGISGQNPTNNESLNRENMSTFDLCELDCEEMINPEFKSSSLTFNPILAKNYYKRDLIRRLQSPLIRVTLNGIECYAMVDTGADFSLVRKHFAYQLNGKRIKWPYPRLNSVNNSDVTPRFLIKNVRIQLGSKTISQDIAIMPRASHKVILGMDFLNEMGLMIDLSTKRVGSLAAMNYTLKKQSTELIKYQKLMREMNTENDELRTKLNSYFTSDPEKICSISEYNTFGKPKQFLRRRRIKRKSNLSLNFATRKDAPTTR